MMMMLRSSGLVVGSPLLRQSLSLGLRGGETDCLGRRLITPAPWTRTGTAVAGFASVTRRRGPLPIPRTGAGSEPGRHVTEGQQRSRSERPPVEEESDEDVEVERIPNPMTEYLKKLKDLSGMFFASRRLGTLKLSEELCEEIRKLLKGYSKELLKLDADNLSQSLRERTRVRPEEVIFKLNPSPSINAMSAGSLGGAHHYKQGDSMAYVAHRMPGIYACILRVLSEITTARPDFKPTTMLDFGTGPATTVWAALALFENSLKTFRLVEPSEDMQIVAKKMLQRRIESTTSPINVEWRRFLFESEGGQPSEADLVMASYSLSEVRMRLPFRCFLPLTDSRTMTSSSGSQSEDQKHYDPCAMESGETRRLSGSGGAWHSARICDRSRGSRPVVVQQTPQRHFSGTCTGTLSSQQQVSHGHELLVSLRSTHGEDSVAAHSKG